MDKIRLAAYLGRSRVNGPGLRAVIWVQGCLLHCPGCFNPEFLELNGGRMVSITEIAQWIDAEREIEGVTFSGGEPFLQALPLAELAEAIHRSKRGVLIFTGFSGAALFQNSASGVQRLLATSDLLVAGPYQRDRQMNHSLLASANQELIFLTERYRGVDFTQQRKVEFRINRNGTTTITGFPKS